MKIAVLCNSVNFVAYQKRMLLLKMEGADLDVYGWERENAPAQVNYVPYKVIANVKFGAGISRLPNILKMLMCSRRMVSKYRAVYAMGFEAGLSAVFASIFSTRHCIIIYEMHDIRNLMLGKGLRGKLLRFLERQIINRSHLVVVTSEAYITEYFVKTLNILPNMHQVIFNKALPSPADTAEIEPTDRIGTKMRIGYFGAIRCSQSVTFLSALLDVCSSKYEIVIYGEYVGVAEPLAFFSDKKKFSYKGPFTEKDIHKIYEEVDLIWIAGNQNKLSADWARTCRFHNACLFRKPLISNMHSLEGRTVRQYQIGIAINLSEPEMAIRNLNEITNKTLAIWNQNFLNIPKSFAFYGQEHNDLLNTIVTLAEC